MALRGTKPLNTLSKVEAPAKAEQQRHHALDLLRGLAALCVANYHFLVWRLNIHVHSAGTFPVYLFFSLSALTMMMVYGRRFEDDIQRGPLIAFFRARAARIIPLLAVVSTGEVVLQHNRVIAGQAVLNGTGLFALGPPGFLEVGNGAWSLGIELAFYVVFPVLALVIGKWPLYRLFVALAVFVAAQQLHIWLVAGAVAPDTAHFWQLYTAPLPSLRSSLPASSSFG